jgi:Tannase and feruloyl esterase
MAPRRHSGVWETGPGRPADPLRGQPAPLAERRALQTGGGGTDGTVVTGLELFSGQPTTMPTALARGFVTLGSDSGHNADSSPRASPGERRRQLHLQPRLTCLIRSRCRDGSDTSGPFSGKPVRAY